MDPARRACAADREDAMKWKHAAAGVLAAVTSVAAPSAHAQSSPAPAQDAAAIAAIRLELDSLHRDDEARIAALEARLALAEAAAGRGAPPASAPGQSAAAQASADEVVIPDQLTPAPATAVTQVAAAAPPTPTASPNAYNPGIAVALNGFFTAARRDTQDARIAGFAAGPDINRPARGFSLGESEVSFSANIDPSLAGFFDFSLDSASAVSLEEAYIRTTALPHGLTFKAGRFLSGIGYLNERHAHDWSFSDAPLPYRAFLDTQLADDGVQVRWLAPIDHYLEFGAEALRGESYPAAGAAHAGAGAYAAFVKTGGDLGVSASWLGGLSYLHAGAANRESGGDLFVGNTDLGVASLVYKWAPQGNATSRNLVLSGEAFRGRDDGRFNGAPLAQTHWGWYAQGVYQFKPQWSAGLRLAGLTSADPGAAFAGTSLDDEGRRPFDVTGLLEFDTSEFGRLRLQYTRDEASRAANDIVVLQYTVIYGPHGAHRY